MDLIRHRRNSAFDTVKIKFSFSALLTYFEVVRDLGFGSWIGSVLYAAFAEHIDLYRVLDQREMYRISTEGDFGGGDFNVPLERITGAAFAATSIEDVVAWGRGWRKQGRLIGDLYVLETDGLGRTFSHLSDPRRMGIDTSDLIAALELYGESRISAEEGIERSGLLDLEFDVPKESICTTGLGCSILLKEWDTFNVYGVVGDRIEKLDGIPPEIQFPILQMMYAIADSDAETLDDLMYDGVWGRGVYVTDNLETARQDAERLGLAVFQVGLTLPQAYSTVFEISRDNTDVSTLGSSLKKGTDGELNALLVEIRPTDESQSAKSFFVSETPLDYTILGNEIDQEALVDATLEDMGIWCGAQGYIDIESWVEVTDPGDCEDYDYLVDDQGFDKVYKQLTETYGSLLREAAGLPFSVKDALRLQDTTRLGHVIKRRGYSAVRSRLNSPFDNYLCILDPRDMRSWVTADLDT
jgi:hypothetical protein